MKEPTPLLLAQPREVRPAPHELPCRWAPARRIFDIAAPTPGPKPALDNTSSSSCLFEEFFPSVGGFSAFHLIANLLRVPSYRNLRLPLPLLS